MALNKKTAPNQWGGTLPRLEMIGKLFLSGAIYLNEQIAPRGLTNSGGIPIRHGAIKKVVVWLTLRVRSIVMAKPGREA
jgi:hypothetical protein